MSALARAALNAAEEVKRLTHELVEAREAFDVERRALVLALTRMLGITGIKKDGCRFTVARAAINYRSEARRALGIEEPGDSQEHTEEVD